MYLIAQIVVVAILIAHLIQIFSMIFSNGEVMSFNKGRKKYFRIVSNEASYRIQWRYSWGIVWRYEIDSRSDDPLTYSDLSGADYDIKTLIDHNNQNVIKNKPYRVLTDKDRIIDTLSEELDSK